MQLDFTPERPVGNLFYGWRPVVDGCDTGNILSNGPVQVGHGVPVPATQPAGLALLSVALLGLAARRWRRNLPAR